MDDPARHRELFAPEAVIDAKPGGAFHIHLNPYADKGMKGLMTCAS
jgi:hypothetical protein